MKPAQIKDLFPHINTPRFNFAAWEDNTSHNLVLLGREVDRPAPYQLPAIGNLVLTEFSGGKLVSDKVVWSPQDKPFLLEDPRAVIINNKLHLGLTAVEKKDNWWHAYPATIVGDTKNIDFSKTNVIHEFGVGKNTTPIDKDIWLFRPVDSFFNHKFLVFKLTGNNVEKTGEIPLPENLPWAKFKFGTALPPIWLDDNNALFLVHGITYFDGIYSYCIGRGLLVRENDKFSIKVHPEPFITPNTFADYKVPELNPEDRRVTYCCGGILNGDNLDLYLNLGDRKTFEATYSLAALTKDLV